MTHQHRAARPNLEEVLSHARIHIVPSNDPPEGRGEPALAPREPAFANAIA
jgi:CO/xanthine dehydrogenase Mo-binding subunit